MSPPGPLLTERQHRRQLRRRRTLIGFGVMTAVILAAVIVLGVNAGRWGVPMFGFTNEHGSKCRNDWLGHSCTRLTLEEVEHHLGMPLPAGTTLVSGTWKQTHDYELSARLVYPQAVAREGWDALSQKYGECRQNLPSPLATVPDLSGLCVMTNDGAVALDGNPSPQIWRIATATQPDGNTVVDVHLRSR